MYCVWCGMSDVCTVARTIYGAGCGVCCVVACGIYCCLVCCMPNNMLFSHRMCLFGSMLNPCDPCRIREAQSKRALSAQPSPLPGCGWRSRISLATVSESAAGGLVEWGRTAWKVGPLSPGSWLAPLSFEGSCSLSSCCWSGGVSWGSRLRFR